MSDEATYRHESGHVVAGYLLGEQPRSVVVLGHRCGWTVSIPADGDNQDRMVVLLAGRLAEQEQVLDVGRRTSDRRQANGIALRLANWPASRDAGLETADWILRRAEQRARDLVAGHRSEIAAIASSIRANGGRLGGHELDAALRLAFRVVAPSSPRRATGEVDFSALNFGRHWDSTPLTLAAIRARAGRGGRRPPVLLRSGAPRT